MFKMFNMKNTIYIIVLAVSCLFSCDKVLEEVPTGGLTADGIYSTEEGLEFALNAAYTEFNFIFSNNEGREQGWTLVTLGTDTFWNGDGGGFKYVNNYNSDFNGSSSIVEIVWEHLYKGINVANAVISRAPEIVEDQERLKSLVAEARFLRGVYYFWLARTWGPVHYTAEETTVPETEATRMPLTDLYPKIIEDLEYAEQNLTTTSGAPGKATSWAAKAALADIYLNLKNYDLAAQYSEDVISNGPYSLVKPFSELWNLENKGNEEVIWAAEFSDNFDIDNGGNPAHMFFLGQYDNLPGMKRDIENGRPWRRFRPSDYLLNLYDMEDERYDATFKTVWYSNDASSAPSGVQVGDTAVWMPRIPLTQNQKDQKPFGVNIFNPDEYKENFYPSTKKWIQPNRPSTNEPSGNRDFIVYRLADVLLMASEANALKSSPDQTKALQYFNEVRMRGYGVDDIALLPVIASVDVDVILEERAKELASEGKRWFDLVRTGKLIERVKLHNPSGALNIQDHHSLRPIPLTQIDRTSNEFPQNPGY